MSLVIRGRIAHVDNYGRLQVYKNHAIGVDRQGKIEFIDSIDGNFEQLLEKYSYQGSHTIMLQSKQFIFPGFIDSHIHASQYPNLGVGRDLPLLDWLEKFTFPLEASFKDESKAKSVYEKAVKRTLANGTTTASYFGTLHENATCILADTCLRLGQRAYIGKVCMNTNLPNYYKDESVEEALAIQERVTSYIQKIDPNFTLIKPVITPRFAVSCTAEMLTKLGEYAQKHPELPIQTHLSENKAEVDFVKELFPKDSSYTGVYNTYNLLRENTILAHCVHLTTEEIKLIKSKGAGISHCGASNTSLSSGEANIRLFKKAGLKIGLGTDCSGGYSPSILDSARQASNVSRHLQMKYPEDSPQLSLEEILDLATMGGAKVLDMDKKIGNFEPGKWFDALLIDLGNEVDSNVDIFPDELEDCERLIAKWVFNGDDRNVLKVWVGGRQVK